MINIETYKKDLLELKLRTSGRIKNISYREMNVNVSNIKQLIKFDDELNATGYKEATRRSYLVMLTCFFEFIGKKSLRSLTKQDVIDYLNDINKTMKKSSVQSYHSRLSRFLLWLNKGEYPECIASLKPKREYTIKLPEHMPTEEEIKRMIDAADNPRDKAIMSVLYESAMRLHSFLNMKIGDLQFDDYGCKVIVRDTKTGDRVIRLVNSVPALKMWIHYHPNKAEDSHLWIKVSRYANHKGEPLKQGGVEKVLRKLSVMAKIDKRIYPHICRHARLSYLASRVPESVLRNIAGWTPKSTMPEVYIHYNNKDVDDAVLTKVYGKKLLEEEKASELLKPVTCMKCKTKNDSTAEFCSRCYNPLSEKAISDVELVKTAIAQILAEAWKQPNPKESLPEAIKRIMGEKDGNK
jgi:integrase/ribosomal protein L40E